MRLPFSLAQKTIEAGALYAAVVAEARRPEWYRDAGVPDTIDGRFAVLTSLLALTDIRLERGGEAAQALGPRLAEVFIADMDAQMREAGFGDPSLGKQVRTMVGALASKVDLWRRAVDGCRPWEAAARQTLYGELPARSASLGIEATRNWWRRLEQASDAALAEGRIA